MTAPETPLFDADHQPQIDPRDAVAAVHAFLHHARAWGTDREIPKRLARLAAEPTPDEAAKLHAWTSWVAFVDHALQELEAGTLDGWFTDDRGL